MNPNVVITTESGDKEETTNNCSFPGFSSDSDKIYFYIESSEDEFPQDVTFSFADSYSNVNEMTLRISENNGKYDFKLVKLVQYLSGN